MSPRPSPRPMSAPMAGTICCTRSFRRRTVAWAWSGNTGSIRQKGELLRLFGLWETPGHHCSADTALDIANDAPTRVVWLEALGRVDGDFDDPCPWVPRLDLGAWSTPHLCSSALAYRSAASWEVAPIVRIQLIRHANQPGYHGSSLKMQSIESAGVPCAIVVAATSNRQPPRMRHTHWWARR